MPKENAVMLGNLLQALNDKLDDVVEVAMKIDSVIT